mmetsp:Transcript_20033/g.28561  ORF Transcript_20033/g.28561 Transcript_20033/m.28561 type:complete len:235 (+) Transcript_20033:540-1244(+)
MFGVQLADCLLAEKRHRHNQRIAERRRAGHPVVGHFSLHKIDQLQDLYLENHGTLLYPGWDSASAYKQTDESFDTIALHHIELQDALKARREQLGHVKLTKDMQYMCDAMGVPLPLLPFSKEGKEERRLFVKMMLQHVGPIDEVKLALEWCKHVDPEKNIHAKQQSLTSPTPTMHQQTMIPQPLHHLQSLLRLESENHRQWGLAILCKNPCGLDHFQYRRHKHFTRHHTSSTAV